MAFKKRYKMNKKKSKKYFSKTADRTHKFNDNSSNFVMRGGIRL